MCKFYLSSLLLHTKCFVNLFHFQLKNVKIALNAYVVDKKRHLELAYSDKHPALKNVSQNKVKKTR